MPELDQTLSTLARAHTGRLKAFSELLIEDIGEIEVLQSRTGLVMMPIRDTAQGVAFHLGEVLVSEAHVRSTEHEGYGMRRGRDLEAAMAMAIIDLALAKGIQADACQRFCKKEAEQQALDDLQILKAVEATRVNMETF